MPPIDPDQLSTTLANLAQSAQELAFRSNRVREWLELSAILARLDSRYGEFYARVEQFSRKPSSFSGSKAVDAREAWNNLRKAELADLRSLSGGLKYISQPLSNNPGEPPPVVGDWSPHIQTLSDQIWGALSPLNPNFPMLVQCAGGLRDALTANVADSRRLVEIEVRELCELTTRLRKNLGLD
jgi:hypothetical protein